MQRIREIDFLRGIAILLVLCRHISYIPILKFGGWIGVDLFFVLSGYLVSKLLFHEYIKFGKINTKRFLIRRGFKIYPLFYSLTIITLLTNYFLGDIPHIKRPELNTTLNEIFFIQNYSFGLWAHTWSLAVEEHFTLV